AAALAEWARALPLTLYATALLLAPIGSLLLVAAHVIWQPRTRRAALTLVGGAVLSLVPTIVLGISAAVLSIREAALGGLLALPILPIAYLVAIYRHRFGGLELSVNRAISIYLFLLVVLTVFLL